jgi:hypothetical protein
VDLFGAEFLRHGTAAEGHRRQPIFLTTGENPNGAHVLFLVGGAMPSGWSAPARGSWRIVLLFDGRDPERSMPPAPLAQREGGEPRRHLWKKAQRQMGKTGMTCGRQRF